MRLPLALATLVLATTGCLTEPSREVALQLSALDVPASVSPDSALHIRITAMAGGCRTFDRFEAERTLVDVSIHALGIDTAREGVSCTGDVRFHQGTYAVFPPFADSVIVRGRQPDGSEIVRVVRVMTVP